MFLNDIPSPFNLLRPKKWWTKILAEYDADLRIFPSQKKPVYRVCRVATLSGGMNLDRFRHVLPHLHPDTQIMLARHLLPVMTFGPDVFNRHPSIIVNILRRRDTWRLAPPDATPAERGDAATDALEQLEADEYAGFKRRLRDESRQRWNAMQIAYKYRTGARVSLVPPRRGGSPASERPTGGLLTTPSA